MEYLCIHERMPVRVIWKSRSEEFPLASPTTIFFSILRNRISHKCAAKKTGYENIGKGGGCRGPFWGALGVTKLDTHAFCCYPSQTLSHLSWSNKTLPSPFHLRHPDDFGVDVWTHCKQIVCLFVCAHLNGKWWGREGSQTPSSSSFTRSIPRLITSKPISLPALTSRHLYFGDFPRTSFFLLRLRSKKSK